MKSRYFDSSEFLKAKVRTRSFFAWRSIIHGRELLNQGLSKQIGNGKSMMVWTDAWVEDEGMRAPWRKNTFFNVNLKVAELIDKRSRDWDLQKLDDLFLPGDILGIKKIKPVALQDDFYIWKHNKSRDFTVKSAYWLASQIVINPCNLDALIGPFTNALKAQVWSLLTDPKIKVYLWKALSGALPVVVALQGKGIRLNKLCQICGMEEESINHILFSCSLARQIWALSDYPVPEFGF